MTDNDITGAVWHNEFPCNLVDTGKKTQGWPKYRRRTIYEYTGDPIHPMTLQADERCFVQPDRHFMTDLGSVPELLQLFLPKDLHNPTFVLHDSACRDHALWFSSTIDGVYTRCYLSSDSAARLLGQGLYAAGYTARARMAWRLVKRFGPQF